MFDRDSLYNVLDSHFVKHLVRDGDDENTDGAAADETGLAQANGAAPASGQALSAEGPDNMLDDLLDELDAVLEELHADFDDSPKALTAIAIGFIDGVVAQSSGSYSSYEDAYVEDMRNPAFAAIDDAVAEFSSQFDGNRDWGEAALGYLRNVAKAGAGEDGDAPVELDETVCLAQAQGFIYGADLSEDYEWKIVQTPAGNLLVTDEEAAEEFMMRQLEQSGGAQGLFGRMFDALGIDLSELEAAIAEASEDEGARGEVVEGESVE